MFLSGSFSYAQKRGIVNATIITDGAMIFRKPSFDSDVIAYQKSGSRVQVTRKTRGGFRKIKTQRGVVGFIRVEDVQTEDDAANVVPEKTVDPFAQEEEEEVEPFMFRRYAGPAFGLLNYGEDIIGQKVQSNLTAFGFKLTGQDVLLSGPLVDINLLISSGAPSYYEQITLEPASGFIFIFDHRFLIPMSEGEDRFFYTAIGPILVLSQFNVELGGVSLAMQQLNLGLTFAGGMALRFGRFSVRAEVNSHWEISRYFSFVTAAQFEF